MNNIFHKLANDAWVDVPEGQGYGGKIFSKEKFAELLVKECASVNYNSPFQDGEFHAREVLEHFGVDE
jgi:hypothetical protein